MEDNGELVSENISSETNEASPEPQESGSENKPEGAVEAKAEAKPTETPFHEHPRWKEMLEQRNQSTEEAKMLRAEMARMQSQLQEFSKPKTADKRTGMLEYLKGINPEFSDFLGTEFASQKDVSELKQMLQEAKEQQFRTAALSEVTKLHTDNKVDAALQQKYNTELEYAYATGRIKNIADISSVYKSVHEGYTKMLEELRRKDRETYVASKKTDAKTPNTQPKGSPAVNKSKVQYSRDPEEARAQMMKRYLEISKASNDV